MHVLVKLALGLVAAVVAVIALAFVLKLVAIVAVIAVAGFTVLFFVNLFRRALASPVRPRGLYP